MKGSNMENIIDPAMKKKKPPLKNELPPFGAPSLLHGHPANVKIDPKREASLAGVIKDMADKRRQEKAKKQ